MFRKNKDTAMGKAMLPLRKRVDRRERTRLGKGDKKTGPAGVMLEDTQNGLDSFEMLCLILTH